MKRTPGLYGLRIYTAGVIRDTDRNVTSITVFRFFHTFEFQRLKMNPSKVTIFPSQMAAWSLSCLCYINNDIIQVARHPVHYANVSQIVQLRAKSISTTSEFP